MESEIKNKNFGERFWGFEFVFGNIFGKTKPILEKKIAKYQEVLLCVRKVTKEDVKRRI